MRDEESLDEDDEALAACDLCGGEGYAEEVGDIGSACDVTHGAELLEEREGEMEPGRGRRGRTPSTLPGSHRGGTC